MKIGAQFYTLHEQCKTLEDFALSLKKVADIGYTTVQISGVCDYEPAWLDAELKKNGLSCVLTHTPQAKIVENPAQVCAEHDVFGCDNVGLGLFKFFDDKGNFFFEDFKSSFTPAIDVLHQNGKYFMYHNHHYEFSKINGKTVMELLAETFPKEKFGFTLDTYWVQYGGANPVEWLEKLAGRVPIIHLKDLGMSVKAKHAPFGNVGPVMLPVGEGNINFERVFIAAEKAGTKYMLVEQDDCNGEDPFDCLKRSYDYLKANGFN